MKGECDINALSVPKNGEHARIAMIVASLLSEKWQAVVTYVLVCPKGWVTVPPTAPLGDSQSSSESTFQAKLTEWAPPPEVAQADNTDNDGVIATMNQQALAVAEMASSTMEKNFKKMPQEKLEELQEKILTLEGVVGQKF